MQTMFALFHGAVQELRLPAPEDFVVPGVRWGSFDELLTPAYWRGQAWQHEMLGNYADHRLGRSLTEEVAACLLGGYGMPAELGLAAFIRLRDQGLLEHEPAPVALEEALTSPFVVHGRLRQYRFPRQKARHLSECLTKLSSFHEPKSDLELRERLLDLPGIGLKTASWIVRNYRKSDSVAIIDVHILRAGRHIGIFRDDWLPQQHYRHLESGFLKFCKALGTSAAFLDGLIWDYMRRMPTLA